MPEGKRAVLGAALRFRNEPKSALRQTPRALNDPRFLPAAASIRGFAVAAWQKRGAHRAKAGRRRPPALFGVFVAAAPKSQAGGAEGGAVVGAVSLPIRGHRGRQVRARGAANQRGRCGVFKRLKTRRTS